ncbi:hypothetical protein IQ07DRAFT_669750 [Pyrenochaeta sp. DS3sAY3a]|nr:hypothetical protein IQ07DRAFT_669750 [Pyrenochaeta sp. DS3sAY3a]
MRQSLGCGVEGRRCEWDAAGQACGMCAGAVQQQLRRGTVEVGVGNGRWWMVVASVVARRGEALAQGAASRERDQPGVGARRRSVAEPLPPGWEGDRVVDSESAGARLKHACTTNSARPALDPPPARPLTARCPASNCTIKLPSSALANHAVCCALDATVRRCVVLPAFSLCSCRRRPLAVHSAPAPAASSQPAQNRPLRAAFARAGKPRRETSALNQQAYCTPQARTHPRHGLGPFHPLRTPGNGFQSSSSLLGPPAAAPSQGRRRTQNTTSANLPDVKRKAAVAAPRPTLTTPKANTTLVLATTHRIILFCHLSTLHACATKRSASARIVLRDVSIGCSCHGRCTMTWVASILGLPCPFIYKTRQIRHVSASRVSANSPSRTTCHGGAVDPGEDPTAQRRLFLGLACHSATTTKSCHDCSIVFLPNQKYQPLLAKSFASGSLKLECQV